MQIETQQDTTAISAQARGAAQQAQTAFLKHWNDTTGGNEYGEPMYCGFAWVDVNVGRTNSQLAKQLAAVGFRKSHRPKTMTLWDPAQHRGQSMDCKEQGAYAYADTLRAAGIDASAGSRAD